MTAKQPLFMLIVAALALGAVGAEAANPTKAQKCEAFKEHGGRGESLVPGATAREAGARAAS